MSGVNVNNSGGANSNLTTQNLTEMQTVGQNKGTKESVTKAQVATSMPGSSGVSGSLPSLPKPGMTGEQAALLLFEIRSKFSEEIIQTSKESVEVDRSQKKISTQKRLKS